MRKLEPFNLRRHWPRLLLAGSVVAGLGVTGLHLQAQVRTQLPALLKDRLQAALGRPVSFRSVEVWPHGIWVSDLRVLPGPTEKVEPLRAHKVRVALDWARLLTTGTLRIDSVDLDRAQLRFGGPGAAPGKPWTSQLLALSRSGIPSFRLNRSSVEVVASRKGEGWSVSDVNGEVHVEPAAFTYQARAGSFTSGATPAASGLRNLRVSGSGSAAGVEVREAAATYQGGAVTASGAVRTEESAALMTVRVSRVPLDRLAKEIGIPLEWAMKGRVSGQVTVDARSNRLRKVAGVVSVERGSVTRGGGVFPWETGTANVVWTSEKTVFRSVRIAGQGLTVAAQGQVLTAEGKPLTSGRFTASGEVTADRSHTVGQVAALLSFQRALGGRWDAGKASVGFRAGGTLGDLASATASGKLHLEGLLLRASEHGEPVTVARLDAEVKRSPNELSLSNLVAETDGLSLTGSARVTNGASGKPGQFLVNGRIRVRDVQSLKKALPRASLWRWIPTVSSAAKGDVAFRAGGSTAHPEKFWTEGTFEASQFRLSARSPLPSQATFFIPIERARGSFRRADGSFTLSGIELEARTFDAQGKVAFHVNSGVSAELHLQTGDWRNLPAMPVGALPELTGGRMTADLTVASPSAEFSRAVVEGGFRLVDAAYAPPREGAAAIPVDEFSARFRWAERTLELPELAIFTPQLRGTGSGRIHSETDGYHLALEIDARSEDAGALVARFTDELRLRGGDARARFSVQAPMDHLALAKIAGTVDVTDAQILHAVEALGLETVQADRLSVDFEHSDASWRLQRLALTAPGLTANLSGSVAANRIDAGVNLQTDRWAAGRPLPVSGGTLSAVGHLSGDPSKAAEMVFRGDLHLHGAALRYASGKLTATGGDLQVSASGEGPLKDALAWLRSGKLSLKGARVVHAGRELPAVTLTGSLTRDGDNIRLADGMLQAGALGARGSGEWSTDGHRLDLVADAASLHEFGIKLPDGVSAKDYHLTATVTGNSKEPLATAAGNVRVGGVRLALKDRPAESLTGAAGDFRYSGSVLTFDKVAASSSLGTLAASGEWSRSGHHAQLTVEGEDIARLGLPLPQGVGTKAFRLEARLDGTAAKPLAAAAGTLVLRDARFDFGPEGPHHLASVEGSVRLEGKRVLFTDIKAAGSAGRFAGSGELSPYAYRFTLDVPEASPAIARWLVPGTIENGRLSGTLTVRGRLPQRSDEEVPSPAANGVFRLADARYLLPAALEMSAQPMAVASLTGRYDHDGQRTVVSDLVLEGDILKARGGVTARSGVAQITADLETPDLGKVVAFWPQLAAWYRGGSAAGALEAVINADGGRGNLKLEARGGTLLLPSAPAEFAGHPVETAALALAFSPETLTFSDVSIRGPKGNVDGEGEWSDSGPVYARGKAWFSKGYTSKLMKPSGWGWLAKLVGVRELKSDFALTGSADRLMLDAGITRSVLWKFARGSVPREFQEIAAGKSPLWIAPVEVAAEASASDGSDR